MAMMGYGTAAPRVGKVAPGTKSSKGLVAGGAVKAHKPTTTKAPQVRRPSPRGR